MEVDNLLNEMPIEKPYDMLRNAIINCTQESEERKLHDLFNNLKLGHLKPSQLLRKMKSLLGANTISDTVLKKLWMGKLHTYTTQILASLSDELDLEQLAEIADKINDNKPGEAVFTTIQTPNVASISNPDNLMQIKESIANITLQVKSLTDNAWRDRRS